MQALAVAFYCICCRSVSIGTSGNGRNTANYRSKRRNAQMIASVASIVVYSIVNYRNILAKSAMESEIVDTFRGLCDGIDILR
jgi:hypothetical protein